MLEGLLREMASGDCAVGGEEGDFFSFGDSFKQAFDLEGDTVGVDRKADEYEGVVLKLLDFVNRLYRSIAFEAFVYGFGDLFRVSRQTEVRDQDL